MANTFKTLPQLTFGESVKTVFTNLTDLKGRSRRSELWWTWLLVTIVTCIVSAALSPFAGGIVSLIIQIVALTGVTVRRLHDRGQCGWWVPASYVLNLAGLIYLQVTGFFDISNSVNPDINEMMAVFTTPFFMLYSLLIMVIQIVIFIFCVMDSKPEPNKYGASPKYVSDDAELV